MTEVERWVQALVEMGEIVDNQTAEGEIGAVIVLCNKSFNELYCLPDIMTPLMIFYVDRYEGMAVFNRNVAASIFQNKGLIEKVEIEKLPERNCRVVVIHTRSPSE